MKGEQAAPTTRETADHIGDPNGMVDHAELARLAETPTLAMNDPMITHLTLRSANVARQEEWDQDGQITAAYRGNELAGEVGEACNVIKKLERERLGILGSRATVEQLADELADVLICADLIAMHYGIDLEAAVARKFNATSEKVGLQTRLAVPDDREGNAAGEAYQVIGALAAATGLFEHPEVQRALDHFSEGCPGEILPWGATLPKGDPA
jgi:NTP pyrophosphatase (non-canonical NTP hydrolase)